MIKLLNGGVTMRMIAGMMMKFKFWFKFWISSGVSSGDSGSSSVTGGSSGSWWGGSGNDYVCPGEDG